MSKLEKIVELLARYGQKNSASVAPLPGKTDRSAVTQVNSEESTRLADSSRRRDLAQPGA